MEREISAEQFRSFERVRQSGKTNMMSWWEVQRLAIREGVYLNRENILEIMTEYTELKDKFKEADDGSSDREGSSEGD